MNIPEPITGILEALESAGYEAWLVGGCVRDLLLGRAPHDYDIATAALPAQVEAIFPHTAPTGLRYGTVTVLCDGKTPGRAEVTTFRREAGYSDRRRPETVLFDAGVRQDLARRDFTVNAMAFHPRRGVFDPFDGQKDLAAGLLRAVGDPRARFEEDALRILRAFRFRAQLGFRIEPETLRAARSTAGLVRAVSRERVRDEMEKLLLTEHPQVAFEALAAGVSCGVFPCPAPLPENTGRLAQTPRTAAARWAGFFALCSMSPQSGAALCTALRFDNETKHRVQALLTLLSAPLPNGRVAIKHLLTQPGMTPALLREGFALAEALQSADTAPQFALLGDILQSGEPYRLNMLALDGHALLAAGAVPGPACGEMLRGLLKLTVEDPALNERGTLLRLACKRWPKHFAG